tara:strand:- start:1132 stop:2865 length:1734 start_codon:yes stop_codon:yes gene_type:complete
MGREQVTLVTCDGNSEPFKDREYECEEPPESIPMYGPDGYYPDDSEMQEWAKGRYGIYIPQTCVYLCNGCAYSGFRGFWIATENEDSFEGFNITLAKLSDAIDMCSQNDYKCNIKVDDCKISDAAADILSKHHGELVLDLTELSDAAAEIFSKHKGDLYLNDLTSLSDAAAESLSKKEGGLRLNGLTTLSDLAAAQLGSHNNLYTNTKIESQIKKTRNQQARISAKIGETVLTKKQAVKLRKLFRSKDVENVLIAVQLIDASQATQDDISDILSSSVLSQLINTWDVAIWNSLAPLLNSYPNAKREFKELAEKRFQQKFKSSYAEKHEANEFLNGFYQGLTKPLALLDLKILDYTSDSWNVGDLELDGLTELSDVAAEGFGKHEGKLSLNGLSSLSVAAAESLSKHEGDLHLSGLTGLSEAAAESLSKHEGELGLSGLTSLSDDPGHIALAESLSKHGGYLNLYGLTSLSDAAAESLSKHEGELCLPGLTTLSDAAAENLSKHEGELELSCLTELSDAAAKSLCKHDGDLTLNGLTELSDTVAESLSKRETKFTFWQLGSNLPASAAKILRDAGHGE